jgi:hypothetical protein
VPYCHIILTGCARKTLTTAQKQKPVIDLKTDTRSVIFLKSVFWTFLGNEAEVRKMTHRTLLEMIRSTYPDPLPVVNVFLVQPVLGRVGAAPINILTIFSSFKNHI